MDRIRAMLSAISSKIRIFYDSLRTAAAESKANHNTADMKSNIPALGKSLWKNNANIANVGAIFLILTALFSVAYFIIYPSKGFYHADCYDTLYWANATYESGKIFSEHFHYSALLPFGAQLWMVPLIAIFGMTMKTQLIGMLIFMLVFALSIFYVCRSLNWEFPWTASALFLVMTLLSTSEKLREIMWSHVIYYSLGLTILFLLFGTAVHLKNFTWNRIMSEPRRFIIFAVLYFLLTVGAAMDGFQIIALTLIPVAGALVISALSEKERLLSRNNAGIAAVLLLTAMGTGAGLLLLNLLKGDITAGYANAFSNFSDVSDWSKNAGKFIEMYFSLIDVGVYSGKPLTELSSFKSILLIFSGMITLVVPLAGLLAFGKKGDFLTRMIVSAHFINSGVIMFVFVCGSISDSNWRLTPMLGTGILASAAVIRWISSVYKPAGKRFAALLLSLLLLCGYISAIYMMLLDKDYGENNPHYVLSEELEIRGLDYGYATFWNASCMTVGSDSAVVTRNIRIEEDQIVPYDYQSMNYWFDTQDDQTTCFVALTYEEYYQIVYTDYWTQLTSEKYLYSFDCGDFHVTVFSSNIF